MVTARAGAALLVLGLVLGATAYAGDRVLSPSAVRPPSPSPTPTTKGDAVGTLGGDGFRVDFLVIGRTVWLSGDRAFWAHALPRETAPAKLAGKYLRTTVSTELVPGLNTLTTRAEFVADWPTDAVPDGRELVNGAEAYRFREVRSGAVMFVALTGEPYPLRVTGDGLLFDFVVHDNPMKLDPPDPADVVAVLP